MGIAWSGILCLGVTAWVCFGEMMGRGKYGDFLWFFLPSTHCLASLAPSVTQFVTFMGDQPLSGAKILYPGTGP